MNVIEKGNISVFQFTLLVAFYIIGASILVVPSGLVSEAKQDAWIVAILGVVTASLFVFLYHALSRMFPNMTLIEMFEDILGTWIGKIVSFLYLFFFFFHSSGLLRVIGDFMTTQVMPETPIQAILTLFTLLIIMGVRLGIETIARAAEICFPWVFLLFLVFIITISPQVEMQNIQPVLEEGMKPIVSGTITFLTLPFVQLVIFLMLYPFVNRKKKVKKAFLLGLSIGGLFLFAVTFFSIVVLGPEITTRQMYPSYILAKKINVADFLTRLEVLIAGIWFLTIYFKLTITFYASTVVIAHTMNLRDYRFLTFPLGMILIVFSIISYEDVVEFQTYISSTWRLLYYYNFGLFLPLVLFIIALVRKKRIHQTKRLSQ